MRRRQTKKRGRKQRALRCLCWIVIVLILNMACNGVPLFHVQARRNLEIRYGLDKTHVIWEETAERGWWDGEFHCLSADSNAAIFYSMYSGFLSGWYSETIQMLNKNTTEVIDAKWSGMYDADRHRTLWAMGYVASDQVACIEYTFIWSGDVVETYLISEKDFIQDGQDRYYVYDTRASMFREDPAFERDEIMISDVTVTARDKDGQMIYQKYLYPSWKEK